MWSGESADRRAAWRWIPSHRFQAILLALSLVPLSASIVATAAIWRYGAHEPNLGWSTRRSDPGVIGAVEPDGPAAGRLLAGDRILAMDGDVRVTVLGTYWKRRYLQPGRPYTLDVLRSGATERVSLD